MKHGKIILGIIALLSVIVVLGLVFWQLASKNDADDSDNGANPSGMMQQPNMMKDEGNQKKENQNSQSYVVSAYFSKHPDSDDDPSKIFPVSRTSPDLGVAKYAVDQVIKGPTAEEAAKGFFSTVQLRDTSSNCGGADFKLTIMGGIARLQFCKPFDHRGVVADGQAESELKATLAQFDTVRKVIILNSSGNCEFGLSGENKCLE